MIWVFESTVKLALVLLNLTADAPRKPVPVTCTEVPTGPLVGSNEVIVGTGEAVTVKFVALVAVPSAFVTAIGPSLAPAGTVAVILCGLLIVNVAETSVESHRVTSGSGPLKLSPVISTGVPTGPLVGVNDEIVGAAANAASAPGMAIVSATSRTTKEIWASATSHPHHDASLAVRKMHGSLVFHPIAASYTLRRPRDRLQAGVPSPRHPWNATRRSASSSSARFVSRDSRSKGSISMRPRSTRHVPATCPSTRNVGRE